jgi:hypothetical protein
MKAIWKKCWKEFYNWFETQWKIAWDILKYSVIGFVQAIFEWLKTIVGGLFAGLWKLVIKPVGKWCYETVMSWIKSI